METEEAVMLFERIVGFQKEQFNASARQSKEWVVRLLERSPLAIVQASAFILQESCDIGEYCRLYAQQREEISLQPQFRGSETD